LWIAEEQLKDLAGNSTSGGSTEGGNNMLNVSSGGKDIMIIKQMHRLYFKLAISLVLPKYFYLC
jgi:hypothetical protein